MRLYTGSLAMMGIVASVVTTSPGYLPHIGPAPLRYEAEPEKLELISPPTESKSDSKSPVTATTNILPEVASNTVTNATSPNALNSTNQPAINVIPVPAIGPNVTTNFGEMPASPMVTPQMLMPFFLQRSAASNQINLILTTNLNFLPPVPVQTPSSSATYSTAPQ